MKTTKFLTALIAFSSIFGLSSCLGSNEDSYVYNSSFASLFNAVVDIDANSDSYGNVVLYDNASYDVEWDATNRTASMKISGLSLPNGMTFAPLTFSDLPWTTNAKGWMQIDFSDKQPTNSTGQITFDRFNLQAVNRTVNSVVFPTCLNISFTLNNQYTIYSLPKRLIEVGSTVVYDGSGDRYEQPADSRSIYQVLLDPTTKKGFIVIESAKFAQNMPAMNMKFADIPFVVSQAGVVTMSASELTPSILSSSAQITDKGTPYEGAKIKNLVLTYVAGKGVDFSFDCSIAVGGAATPTTYHVVFTIKYPDATSSLGSK